MKLAEISEALPVASNQEIKALIQGFDSALLRCPLESANQSPSDENDSKTPQVIVNVLILPLP